MSARINSSEPFARHPAIHTRFAVQSLIAAWRPAHLLFRSNLRARHRRALAGYLWLVLPGVVIAIAFTLLRKGSLFASGPIHLPFALFALSGIFLWQCFVDGLTGPLQNLQRERRFLAVTPAPQEAVLLAGIMDNLLAVGVRMLLLGAVMLMFGLAPSLYWILVPCTAVVMLFCGLSIGMLIAPIGQLYDDISAIITIVSAYGLFCLPIIYPIPASSLLAWNPLVGVIDTAHAWMGGTAASFSMFAAIVFIALLLPVGWAALWIARAHVAARAR